MQNNNPLSHVLYMDYAATTPIDARVVTAMAAAYTTGNAASRHHPHGMRANRIIAEARQEIAAKAGCADDGVVFTSGATEANNMALLGLADALMKAGKTHIITSSVEHISVLAPLRMLEQRGFTITYLPVKPCAMIDSAVLARHITPQTGLVSIQAVNNEVGVIQPLAEIADHLRGGDILFHCDGAQALGRVALDMAVLGLDALSLSAHKAYGPQGVGALCLSQRARMLIQPIAFGGGQEGDGLRSGTQAVPLIAGFAEACRLLEISEQTRMHALRADLLHQIADLGVVVQGHSDPDWNVPQIVNLRFPGIDNDTLLMALPNLSCGLGSACSAQGGNKPSHVIAAMTGNTEAAAQSIRLSFGRFTTQDDINQLAAMLRQAVHHIHTLQEAA